MKRFWLVLLSLGLIMAFSASTFAADVKFSGSFYAAGVYLNKLSLDKSTDSLSTAFYYQRLRVRTDFVVTPGVTLITRFDALERAWGAARSAITTGVPALDSLSAGTVSENQNIAFDWAYISWASPVGLINVGYMLDGTWGTVFGDTSLVSGRIVQILPIGNFTWLAVIAKLTENSATTVSQTNAAVALSAVTQSDKDYDKYCGAGIYNFAGGNAGLIYCYLPNATTRIGGTPAQEATSYKTQRHVVMPYFMGQFGPVKVQAEVDYWWGKDRKYDSATTGDVSLSNLAGWVDAVATFGPVYFGGTFAYVAGDDPDTTDREGGVASGGLDWNPTLILFNYNDLAKWVGVTLPSAGVTNAFFYQAKLGVKPTDKLDIMGTFTYANADKVAANISKNYGYEIDVTGTYKITNNLSYMLGVGYLFAGDYFKGTSTTAQLRDDYLVINKLTLTF